MKFDLLTAVLAAQVPLALGHARWKCPPPRDEFDEDHHKIRLANTGNKVGPCGPLSGKFGANGIRKLEPGWQTLIWEESIAHKGSPFRLAIIDGNETAKVVLLDHIPHWDAAGPTPYVQSTYVPYKMSIYIPDVACKQCSLQLLYFMTDKSTKCGLDICTYYPEDSACSGRTDASEPTCFGAPNDTPCKHTDNCYSNYHSCTDVVITGQTPLDEIKYEQPEDWPYREKDMGKYGLEDAEWKDGWLVGVPSNFTTLAGNSLCSADLLKAVQ